MSESKQKKVHCNPFNPDPSPPPDGPTRPRPSPPNKPGQTAE